VKDTNKDTMADYLNFSRVLG
jgi:hypothetical protein